MYKYLPCVTVLTSEASLQSELSEIKKWNSCCVCILHFGSKISSSVYSANFCKIMQNLHKSEISSFPIQIDTYHQITPWWCNLAWNNQPDINNQQFQFNFQIQPRANIHIHWRSVCLSKSIQNIEHIRQWLCY